MQFRKIRKLLKIANENLGCSEEQIKSTEVRLGIELPDELKEYYRTFGNHQGKVIFYDDMINVEELEIGEEGFLVFYRGSQDGVSWGIRIDEIETGFVYHKLGKWVEDNYKLDRTILALGLRSAVTCLPFFAFRWDVEESEEQKVYSNFKIMEEGFNLWNTRFFQNQPNEIIGLTKSEGKVNLFIAANNEKDFLRIKSIFKDDWYSIENQLRKIRERNERETSD